MRNALRLLVLLLAGLAFGASARAQVVIAPTFLSIDATQPVTTFTVINRGAVAQEITIDFRFGFGQSDSTGAWEVAYDVDAGIAEAHSAAPWLRAFPRRMVLEPGARQAVRVMAQLPSGLADGAYWTRVLVGSQEQAPLATTATGALTAQVSIALEQSLLLVVHRGASTTALRLDEAAAQVVGSTVRLTTPIARTGDEAFFGTLDVRVVDAEGAEVHAFDRPSSVYFDFVERVDLDVAGWAPGSYRAELTFRGGRSNAPAGRLPALNPVSTEIAFEIPAQAPEAEEPAPAAEDATAEDATAASAASR